jgi:hypothetical protein
VIEGGAECLAALLEEISLAGEIDLLEELGGDLPGCGWGVSASGSASTIEARNNTSYFPTGSIL